MRPMLATRGDKPPVGSEWLHEIKWDGIRALVEIKKGTLRVTSRSERPITSAFPELAPLAGLPDGLVLDGEIVAVAQDGAAPTFGAIADRVHVLDERRASRLADTVPATLMVFDLLMCEGQPVTSLPLVARRQLLGALGLDDLDRVQMTPTFDDADVLLHAVRDQGLEGIVSKRRESLYRPGMRSADWLKFPLRTSDSFLIGGYRWEKGGRRIGSLLLGEPTPDGLAYRGRVGLAVPARTEHALATLLAGSEIEAGAFLDVPDEDTREVTWVQPSLVVDVEFLERTGDGRLRHPTYRGLRSDLSPSDLA